MILERKSQEIVDDNNFGSIVVIAYVLIIIVQSINLYRLCHEKEEEMYGRLKHIGIMEKLVINRAIKQHVPDLTKGDRRKLLNCIVKKAQELSIEEFLAILKEVDKLKT